MGKFNGLRKSLKKLTGRQKKDHGKIEIVEKNQRKWNGSQAPPKKSREDRNTQIIVKYLKKNSREDRKTIMGRQKWLKKNQGKMEWIASPSKTHGKIEIHK